MYFIIYCKLNAGQLTILRWTDAKINLSLRFVHGNHVHFVGFSAIYSEKICFTLIPSHSGLTGAISIKDYRPVAKTTSLALYSLQSRAYIYDEVVTSYTKWYRNRESSCDQCS